MTDTCATCMWARPAPARIDMSGCESAFDRQGVRWIDRILCNRMPQAVENDATYRCGEFLKRRDAA